MGKYGYNYPWSGRLGRIANCCLYCGESGAEFQISSYAVSCLKPDCREKRRADAEPIPELQVAYDQRYVKAARAWCDAHGIDYAATVANYELHLGPQIQERDSPIPGAENDYTVRKAGF